MPSEFTSDKLHNTTNEGNPSSSSIPTDPTLPQTTTNKQPGLAKNENDSSPPKQQENVTTNQSYNPNSNFNLEPV